MNLRVRILHFVDGIGALGGRMSLSAERVPGIPCAKQIKRLKGEGYLIEFNDKLVVVHDVQIRCVEVVDEDAVVEEEAAPAEAAPAADPEPLPTAKANPTEGLLPGEMYMDEHGRYARWYPNGMTKTQYEASLLEPRAHAPAPPAKAKKRKSEKAKVEPVEPAAEPEKES